MDKNRVIWQEGLFLRPQHFQQQERFLLSWVEERCKVVRPFNWGFTQLTLDNESLALGKLKIIACQGVFPDGTPFDVPNTVPPPEPLDIPADMQDCLIYLGLPLYRAGIQDLSDQQHHNKLARYQLEEASVRDVYTMGMDDPADLQVGQLQLSILTADDNTRAYSLLPLAHVRERNSDQQVQLNQQFIPSVLHCGAEQSLSAYIREILGLLKLRGDALAVNMVAPDTGGTGSIANFMKLQTINRYELVFAHLQEVSSLHPEALFQQMLMLAGDMAIFHHEQRRVPAMPDYQHHDLAQCFQPLMAEIRLAFSHEEFRKALQLEIIKHKYGVWAARIEDKSLLGSASFVLAAKANMASEEVRQTFPRKTKISTVEKIASVVKGGAKAIEFYPLQVAPPQIKFHMGFTYFEINTHHSDWKLLETSGGLAVHIGADYPNLELELWAIRS